MLCCASSYESSDHMLQKMHNYNAIMCFFSVPLYMFCQTVVLVIWFFTLVAFEGSFSTVHIQMISQTVCLGSCIIALVAFERFFHSMYFHVPFQVRYLVKSAIALTAMIWLFHRVCFYMPSQMCFGIKQFFTLGTFVWLFSTVPAHMTLQISGSKWCIIALFALMRLFSNMFFQVSFKMRFCEEYRTAMVTFVRLSPLCLFKCILKLPGWYDL